MLRRLPNAVCAPNVESRFRPMDLKSTPWPEARLAMWIDARPYNGSARAFRPLPNNSDDMRPDKAVRLPNRYAATSKEHIANFTMSRRFRSEHRVLWLA